MHMYANTKTKNVHVLLCSSVPRTVLPASFTGTSLAKRRSPKLPLQVILATRCGAAVQQCPSIETIELSDDITGDNTGK